MDRNQKPLKHDFHCNYSTFFNYHRVLIILQGSSKEWSNGKLYIFMEIELLSSFCIFSFRFTFLGGQTCLIKTIPKKMV